MSKYKVGLGKIHFKYGLTFHFTFFEGLCFGFVFDYFLRVISNFSAILVLAFKFIFVYCCVLFPVYLYKIYIFHDLPVLFFILVQILPYSNQSSISIIAHKVLPYS